MNDIRMLNNFCHTRMTKGAVADWLLSQESCEYDFAVPESFVKQMGLNARHHVWLYKKGSFFGEAFDLAAGVMERLSSNKDQLSERTVKTIEEKVEAWTRQ